MSRSNDDLRILKLSPSDLDNLSLEEQNQKLRKQWYKLSLQYHPDRRPGYETLFHEITEAYDRLTASAPSQYQHDIQQYFTAQDVNIPDFAFDFAQQEGIALTYEALLNQFSSLPSEQAKQKFVQYYRLFLNLAISLEKQQDTLNRQRVEHLYAQTQETFSQRFIREWRLLVLRIFAEEYLNDFLYRHALGTGEIWPILATRKLFNPLKCLIFIVNSLLLLGLSGGDYLIAKKIQQWFQEFSNAYHNPNRNKYAVAKIIAKLLCFSAICILPFYLMPSIAFYLMSLPFLQRCLEIIASPVSKYVRPCSKHLGYSEKIVSTMSLIGATVTIAWCSFHTSFILASLPLILQVLNALALCYVLYSLAKLLKLMYQLQPTLAIFQVILFASSMLFQLIFPLPESLTAPTLSNLFGEFLLSLSTCTALEFAQAILADLSAYQAELIEILPLPPEPVESNLQQACLLGYKKAIWSSRLFNTSKDASSIGLQEACNTHPISACLWGRKQPLESPVTFHEEYSSLTH